MRGLLELVLEVDDLERSIAFYRDVLGMAEVQVWPPPRRAAWLDMGSQAVLGLWPRSSGGEGVAIAGARGGAHVHFAMYVDPGALPEWRRRLDEAGVRIEESAEFGPGNKSVFVKDPDGNVVELADWSLDWAGQPVVLVDRRAP